MACGKTLIYTNKASGPELITDKVNGILVDPTDIDQIASAMQFLLKNPQKCLQIGENAFNTILNNYTEDIIVNNIEQYYFKILNHKS